MRTKATDDGRGSRALRTDIPNAVREEKESVRPRDLGRRFDEVAEDLMEPGGLLEDTASLASARRRLRGKVPDFEYYRGDDVPGEPKNDEELEAHRSRMKEWMKPRWVTSCTPKTNGEVLCILAKPKSKAKPKKVRRNHLNTFECPVPGCGFVYRGFYWMSRKSNHIKDCHPEKRGTGLGAKSLIAEFQVGELNVPDGEEPWWRCPFCPMGLAKPLGYEKGVPMKTDLHNRLWTAKRRHWQRAHPEKTWADFKVAKVKGSFGNATWAMRESLQARAAATASNRLLETIRDSGGHTLVAIRMPDDRAKPITSRQDATHDMLLCTVCGKRGSVTSHRVFPCGDTVTARVRSLNLRKRDIERVDALIEEVKGMPGREKQTAALEATAKTLRDTLDIPPRWAQKPTHEMKPIMVIKRKKPHATAVCTVCKTMAEDREHGRRLNKIPCFQGVPRDASEKSRKKFVVKLREAADAAKKAGQSHTAKEYRRAAKMLTLATFDAPPGLTTGRKRKTDAPDGSDSPTSAAGTMTDGSTVPTTPSRRSRRRREKGPHTPSGGADSEGTALSPLPFA